MRTGLPAEYGGGTRDRVRAALRDLARTLGWEDSQGRILGRLIPPGGTVLVKPNWVLHTNHGGWGLGPLITHADLIVAVTEAVLATEAGELTIADAPIQGCDFGRLTAETGLADWAADLAKADPRFQGLVDLRRTIRIQTDGREATRENIRPADEFVLYDLGSDSLLEPITTSDARFRVTQYHPEYLGRTHAPGKHQYLVAREVPDADLVINLPKLKTHKKAGITCALKNLVGINGNKEYLPHHRVGSPAEGGDCYPSPSRVKRGLEWAFDRYNSSAHAATRAIWSHAIRFLQAVAHRQGDRLGIEGSWSGNDTVWRMCLDLNRILIYGRLDGSLGDRPGRRVVHIVDALVAGQGDGPLHSSPLRLGLLLAGESAPAVDWVGARILGYQPERIPISRHAFENFRWPLATFPPEAVTAIDAVSGRLLHPSEVDSLTPASVSHPAGWIDAVRPSA